MEMSAFEFLPKQAPRGALTPDQDYRFLLKYEGRMLPIYNMFDVYKDDTNDPRRAHTVVVCLGDGQWQTITDCVPEEIFPREVY